MSIKRCLKSFRSGARGFSTGDLVPDSHPLVERFPGFFEPVEDYVSRLYPEYTPESSSAHTEAPEPPPAKHATKKTASRRTPTSRAESK